MGGAHGGFTARRGGGEARGRRGEVGDQRACGQATAAWGCGAGGGAWVAAWVGARVGARVGGAPQRVGHLAAHHVQLRQVLRVLQHVEPLVPSRVVAQVLLQQLLYVGELVLPAAKRAEDPLAVAPRVVVLRIATLAQHSADKAELLFGFGLGLGLGVRLRAAAPVQQTRRRGASTWAGARPCEPSLSASTTARRWCHTW